LELAIHKRSCRIRPAARFARLRQASLGGWTCRRICAAFAG